MEILDFIQTHMRNNFLDILMPQVTRLCDNAEIWIAAALILILFKKYRGVGVSVIIALLLSLIIGNMWLKPLFARPRPFYANTDILLLIPAPPDFSFPSGHTMSSFAAATVILAGNKRLGIPAVIFAAVIAFSRMYLYVHYMSDIIAGMLIGVVFGMFSIYIRKVVLKGFIKAKSGQ